MAHQAHSYHMVDPSPWPIFGAAAALLTTSGLVMWFHYNSFALLATGLLSVLLVMFQWWRDIVRESTFQGHHTPTVQKGLLSWLKKMGPEGLAELQVAASKAATLAHKGLIKTYLGSFALSILVMILTTQTF